MQIKLTFLKLWKIDENKKAQVKIDYNPLAFIKLNVYNNKTIIST